MSFEAFETSRSRGAPDTLYKFTFQSKIFAYTDAEQPITFGGVDYLPVPIRRGSLSSSGTLDKSTLTLNMPHNTDVVELFRVHPPSDIVNLTIFQGHHEDPENQFLAVWTGRVLSCPREKTEASVVCEPVSTSMRRPGLRRRYQYGCPHALYGPQCGVDRTAFTVTALVTSASGATIDLPNGWNGSFDSAKFVGGLAEWTVDDVTELRTILRVNAADRRITVSGRVSGLAFGQTVKLSLGCNHLMSGCNVFANIHNFGGQPWIPKKNPVGFVNQYY